MGHLSVFEISGTGMDMQMLRLETIANNLANVGVTRSQSGSVYKPLQVVATAANVDFDSVFSSDIESILQGVEHLEVVPQNVLPRRVYDPSHPDAAADGFVEMPNINPVNEMINLMEATRAYEANIRVMNAAKIMAARASEIGRN